MRPRLVECVPNFSEGRDPSKVHAIADAIRSVSGATVLHIEMDEDHNRSVITFAAPPETVGEAALAAVAQARDLIDLTRHQGVHPRIGATDVLPFVPLEGVTLAECAEIAVRTGHAIWQRCGIPIYLYEAAARTPERKNLENIRRGQFEGLRDEAVTNPDRAPDIGGPALHATAGATVVGARKFLIAYNINLNTSDAGVAMAIAKTIRQSSGGMPCVKALGVMLRSRNLAQVTMNLTDFETTPVHMVYDAVAREAAAYGVSIAGSEVIGLIPKRALELAAAHYLRIEEFDPLMILENRLSTSLEES